MTKRRYEILVALSRVGCYIVDQIDWKRPCTNRARKVPALTHGGWRDYALQHATVRIETVRKMEKAGLIEEFCPHQSGPFTHYRITDAGRAAIQAV